MRFCASSMRHAGTGMRPSDPSVCGKRGMVLVHLNDGTSRSFKVLCSQENSSHVTNRLYKEGILPNTLDALQQNQ